MSDEPRDGVAIVGMAGRFPGAPDVERFWENLAAGVESVAFFRREELAAAGVDPAELDDPAYVPARAAVEGAELFDADLFGYTPREAALIDPQHRLLLECAWEALEHAGHDPRRDDGLIGVYVGAGPNAYLLLNLISRREELAAAGAFQTMLANQGDFLANRLSYKLGLRGPSLTVQTACSTSLVAVHLAVQSLLNGECDLALAGGVRLAFPRPGGYLYQPDGILSSDGHCRPFDAAADGSIDGEGAAIVVLKRLGDALADGDHVHAVILGTAINNDGDERVGFTAPGIGGQAGVLAMAQAVAGVDLETIGFVEGHGTGTPLGDPIEVAALRQVFEGSTARKRFCALGSVKANVGHLDAAAGVTSLIKAALALERGVIPPMPNFRRPNPRLGLEESPFFVNAEPLPWPPGAAPRQAGVSSFGMGGTNAHAVLEEAPAVAAGDPAPPWQLLVLSAASAAALETLTDRLADRFARHPGLDLADVAFTLQIGRQELAHRRALVCRSLADAREALAARDPERVRSAVVDRETSGGREAVPAAASRDPAALASLGERWLRGAEVDWRALHAGARRLRVPLPAYPFQRQPYWIGPLVERAPGAEALAAAGEAPPRPAAEPRPRRPRPAIGPAYEPPRSDLERRLAELYEDLLGVAPVGAFDRFFELGGHSLLGLQLLSRVRTELGSEVRLEALFERSSVADLAELIAAAGVAPGAADEIPRVPRGGPLPLSFAQERLWFLDRLDPGTTAFNLTEGVRLAGPLDLPTFARALAEVVRRHEALRTAFVEVQGLPAQRILPEVAVPLAVVDLAALPAGRREAEAERLALRAGDHRFDLARPPLFTAALHRLGRERHDVVLVLHHIVGDGWSTTVLLSELTEIYGAFAAGEPSPLPELPVQYADFAAWQRARMDEAEMARQLAGWKARLAPPLSVIDLPTDRPRPPVQTSRGLSEERFMPPAVADAVRALGADEGATPFMVLLAGYALLLSRWSGQQDLIVGSPIAGRGRRELERMIGVFINMLPLRVDLAGDPTFRELLGRVRETALAAYAGQDVPIERLIEEAQPQRDLSRSPLFQVLLNVQEFPHPSLELPGLTIEPLPLRELPSRFDLTIYGEEVRSGGISLELVYNADLFDRPAMAAFLDQLRQLLEGAAAEPDAPVSRIPLLTPAATALLPDPRAPLDAGPWRGAVHERFVEQAARAPERPAVRDARGAWTYGELAERAARLAWRLRVEGVGRGDLVAVYAWRSAPLVQALLGTLGAGAAFLVLDPAHPPRRLRAAVDQARPRAWVALAAAGPPPKELADALPGGGILLGESGEVEAPAADGAPAAPARPHDLAYVAFTSGSTGEPKGILGTHGPLAHFCAWHAATFGLGADDRFSLLSGLAHDPLLRDVFTPLALGALLCVPDPDDLGDPARLARWLARERITVCHLTPAFGQLVADGGVPLLDLRRAFFGGDVLTERDIARLRAVAPRAACVNFYGATETPQAVAWHDASDAGAWPSRRVPVGRGIDGVQLLVLGPSGDLAAPGELGEVCVRTPHLALGYLGDARLTAERFAANPATGDPRDRIYRTGDLGRYRHDGAVDLAGRRDRQVQVRGFRVEPAEVEAALAEHPAVREAVVAAREESSGEKRLVAYVVSVEESGASRLDASALRAFLAARLPSYMVPSAIAFLLALPLTPNGKLDLRALPEPEPPERTAAATEAPATPEEEGVAAIWRELLGLERVGRHESFFELGGHSLLGARVVAAVRERFGVEAPLRTVFAQPTVAGLAAAVAALGGATASGADRIPRLPRDGRRFPVSPSQLREWILDRLQPGSAAYNVFGGAKVTGPADLAALDRSIQEIVRRHESLRLTFAPAEGEDGEPVQVVAPVLRVPLPLVDLAALPPARREAEGPRLARLLQTAPFDLERGPLVRAGVVRTSAREHRVVVAAHHIVADGWSMGILFRELAALYEAFSAGRPSPLPELPVQYADYAVWQRRRLEGEGLERQLDYWRRQLAGVPPLELPTDRPRPAVQRFEGRKLPFRLPPEVAAGLCELAQREGASPFMALLAAFSALLSRSSGQDDFAVGTYSGNRGQAELEGVIGFFINTLVLRLDLGGEAGFRALLGRAREVTLEAFAHQDAPFERLLEALHVQRDLSRTPLFQTMLVLHNFPRAPVDVAGVRLEPMPFDQAHEDFDLTLWLNDDAGALAGAFTYSVALFEEATVARFGERLVALLRAALAEPDRSVHALPLLAAGERRQLLAEWGRGPTLTAPAERLHDLLARQAERTPDAVAVASDAGALTYRELQARADRLARRLRALGMEPEVRVALCTERSLEMIVGLLGVLGAGGGYVPLDPTQPRERLAWLLADAGAAFLLTQQRLLDRLPPDPGPLLLLDGVADEPEADERAAPPPPVEPAGLAYVIYTSGSTGRPKAVAVEHRSIATYAETAAAAFDLGPQDRVLQFASLAFDTSAEEIYAALASGATLVLRPDDMAGSIAHFLRELERLRITVLDLPTAYWHELVDGLGREGMLPACVRLVVLGGERVLPEKLALWQEKVGPGVRLLNTYGPTETTVVATVCDLRAGTNGAPIGRPVAGASAYVLDRQGKPALVGVPGELSVGGVGVARGYLGRPDLTAERFVPDPFAAVPGARLYHTRDLARWRPDGELEFLGRTDQQVKIRGFRIELEEIEAALRACPGVREAAVLAREEGAGDKRLVAYVVPDDPAVAAGGEETDASRSLATAARSFLAARLPEYMVPAAFGVLSALPLTPSGKVDRRALPAARVLRPAGGDGYVAPASELERTIAAVWRDLLGVERIGAADNFFDLGAHSLLLVRAHGRLRQALGRELSVVDLFRHPSVGALARHLGSAKERPAFLEVEDLAQRQRAALGQRQQQMKRLKALTGGGAGR